MDAEELKALLAEARDSVALLVAEYEAVGQKTRLIEPERQLLARIDAALAETMIQSKAMIAVREACRRRMPLDGADAQALEGALALTERERDAAQDELARIRSFGTPDGSWIRGYERGYARGTEDAATAIREEAAVVSLETHASDSRAAEECAARIRALPIPKGMVRRGV
jgi:hypothetical protein